jgi:spermidine synthase
MYLDEKNPQDLLHDYTKYYKLYKLIRPELKNVLVLGGGIYTIPKAIQSEQSTVKIDVVDIEPSLDKLSEKYFRLNKNQNLNSFTEDGRRFLAHNSNKYDLIFSDVYQSIYSIPAHLTTQEFFSLVNENLSEDGVFIINTIGALDYSKTTDSEKTITGVLIKTFQSVFPSSYYIAVDSANKSGFQNIIFVAFKSKEIINIEEKIDSYLSIDREDEAFFQQLKEKVLNTSLYNLENYQPLTDDFAPVEYLTARLLRRNL